ncbi:MAG: hypothetical protein K5871_11665 [Lachnospiraceae bacterium]|nr:hypothetical protein [Lachnospiraceae bacterium]
MGLFKSKAAAEMDRVIQRIEMNMSNNYKDAAQMNFAELEGMFDRASQEGSLKPKEREQYGSRIEEFRSRLKGYSHKDQKPYWH